MADCDGSFTDRRPHPACDRLQADAMLIHRPDLDLRIWVLAPLVRGGALELFLSGHDPLGRRLRMPWPRLLDRVADRDQRIPAALIVHRFEPVILRQPARNLRPVHTPPLSGGGVDALSACERLGRQDRRLGSVVDALIAEPARATIVVAFDQGAHPAWRERQDLRRLVDVVARRQQPQRMKMALGDRLHPRAGTSLDFGYGNMRRIAVMIVPSWTNYDPPSNCFDSAWESPKQPGINQPELVSLLAPIFRTAWYCVVPFVPIVKKGAFSTNGIALASPDRRCRRQR